MRLEILLFIALTVNAQSKQIFNIHSTLPPQQVIGDAPYDIAENLLYENIYCVGGVENAQNPYLLVPGTAGNYEEDWKLTYEILLGKLLANDSTVSISGYFPGGLGYDVCGSSPPPFMLADIQDSSQYITYAIAYLSQHKKIPITSWSQGSLATTWSLTFWPSIRSGVSNFISFAGDIRGVNTLAVTSNELPTFSSTSTQRFTKRVEKRQTRKSAPASIQQSASSEFISNAIRKGNSHAWVPTTSIYSSVDDVVQPEGFIANDTLATSFIGGEAGNILVQQFCPGLPVLHEFHQYINFSWQVVKLALTSPSGFASQAMVSAANIPCNLIPAPGLGVEAIAAIEYGLAIAVIRGQDPKYGVESEPKAKPYISTFPDNQVHGY